jgi:hypothetical protein
MRHRSPKKRGGNLASILNQAVVPFGLLGLQQTYKKKRHGGKKTRKHGGKKTRKHGEKKTSQLFSIF